MRLLDSNANTSFLRGYGQIHPLTTYNPNVLLSSFSTVAAVQFRSGTTGTTALAQVSADAVISDLRFSAAGGIRMLTGAGAPVDRLSILSNGNVGIGTASPATKLHVGGNLLLAHGSSLQIIRNTSSSVINAVGIPAGTDILRLTMPTPVSTSIGLEVVDSSAIPVLSLRRDGNLGIGTTTPQTRLEVAGVITCGGINSISPYVQTIQGTSAVPAENPLLLLRRSASEPTGGNKVFAELLQDDVSSPVVSETFISLRFHHAYRYWHRLEARGNGFHFKTGSLSSDEYVPVSAGALTSTGGIKASLSTSGGFAGTPGLDLVTTSAATANTDHKPSPNLIMTASIWASGAPALRTMMMQVQGICSANNRYGLALASTTSSGLAWFDGAGGFSVGALPSSGSPAIEAGYINADAGYKINHVAAPFVPIGAIIPWARYIVSPSIGIPLPPGFVLCDGSSATIYFGGSSYAITTPNLNGTTNANKPFLRGSATPSGGVVSSTLCHTHTVASQTISLSISTGTSHAVVTSVTSPTGATEPLPAYYEVVYIMRVS
jgi:hypothetical protein